MEYGLLGDVFVSKRKVVEQRLFWELIYGAEILILTPREMKRSMLGIELEARNFANEQNLHIV